jgi:hypothetical protein
MFSSLPLQWLDFPLVLHSRWFSPENEYVLSGNFSMIVENTCALPTSQAIYDHIMGKAKAWGLVVGSLSLSFLSLPSLLPLCFGLGLLTLLSLGCSSVVCFVLSDVRTRLAGHHVHEHAGHSQQRLLLLSPPRSFSHPFPFLFVLFFSLGLDRCSVR